MLPISLDEIELARFLFALVVLISSAHGLGYLLQRLFYIPKVIGEIGAGVILGPSVLGYVSPAAYSWLFNAFAGEGQLIAGMYWIGLVLLMFISGFEIQKTIDRADKKLISFLLVGATVMPFAAGWFASSVYDFSRFLGPKDNLLALSIVVAIAIAVTSIPVISKIFMDLGVMKTRFAKIVLATATIEDIILWVALAIATGLVSNEAVSMGSIAWKVFATLGLFIAALSVLPRLFEYASRSRFNVVLKSSATGYVLLTCFIFATLASALSVNIIFGAFLAGVVVGMTSHERVSAVKSHITELGFGFFIPLYFAVVGLKLNLLHQVDLTFLGVFLLFAVVVKMLGTALAARAAGENWLSSFNFGVAMNARGGPGIVLATVAFDFGIINEALFAVLILVALLTSAAAGYWFRYVLARRWSLMTG